MSYQRQREKSAELRCFAEFKQDNPALIEAIGLPSFVIEDYQHFVYFLMHGVTSPHAALCFTLEDLSKENRELYLILLDLYFEAGLADADLGGLTNAEQKELEQKHPRQFTTRRQRDVSR